MDSNIGLEEYQSEFGKIDGPELDENVSSSDEEVVEEHTKITESDRRNIINEAFRNQDEKRVTGLEDFKPAISYAKIGKKLEIWSSIV